MNPKYAGVILRMRRGFSFGLWGILCRAVPDRTELDSASPLNEWPFTVMDTHARESGLDPSDYLRLFCP